MGYTQADIDNLKKAIITGAKSVRLGAGENSQETVLRTLAEMKEILADAEAEVSGKKSQSMTSIVEHSRW